MHLKKQNKTKENKNPNRLVDRLRFRPCFCGVDDNALEGRMRDLMFQMTFEFLTEVRDVNS